MAMDVSTERRRIGTFVAGALVFLAASFLGVSLLLGVFSLGTARSNLAVPGLILLSAYGFSSALVPCFLLVASILLLIPGWSLRPAVLLSGSFIPFFTVAGGERLIRHLSTSLSGSPTLGVIIPGLVVSIALALLVEYLLLLFASDYIAARMGSSVPLAHERESESATDNADSTDFAGASDFADESRDGVGAEPTEHSLDEVIDRAIVASPEALEAEVPEAIADEVPEETAERVPVTSCDAQGCFTSSPVSKTSGVPGADKVYVDFEKMRAPFDLPVLENWVEPGDGNTGIDGIDGADGMMDSDPGEAYETDRVIQAIDSDLASRDAFELEKKAFNEDSFSDCTDSIEPLAEEIIEDDIIDELLEGDAHDELADVDEVVDPDELIDADELVDAEVDAYLPEERGAGAIAVPLDSELPPVVTVPPHSHTASSGLDPALSDTPGGAIGVAAKLFKKKSRVAYSVPYDILNTYPDGEYWIVDDTTRRAAAALKDTLNEFRIEADVTGIRKGPVITMFEILPAPGVKLSKIVGLQDNIALRLAASSVRIVAPIPGKHAVGIEVPNQKRAIVSFRELIETDTPAAKKMEIPVVLGKDITGEAQLLDLASTPHLLIAGSTGSGKSVCVNSIILSILYKRSPEDVKLILIDPKIVELKLYNDIAHLLAPVITEPKKAFQSLQYCLCEMERRYALLDGMGVRDIKSYNRRIKERNIATEKIPYLVVIIDEFADLMATTGKELESTVARLCAMSRAVGIHLVLATQRPSIDVITGLIKANIPTRIAFMVASKMDSRIIIDQVGAEKLLGKGDMLYSSATDPFPVRIQGAYVSEEEVERVVEHVKTLGDPEYIDEEIFVEDDDDSSVEASLFSDGEDPLYEKALEIVLLAGKASASYIQRKLKIGYNRAARLVEDMEARGIVGPANGSKPRDVMHRPN